MFFRVIKSPVFPMRAPSQIFAWSVLALLGVGSPCSKGALAQSAPDVFAAPNGANLSDSDHAAGNGGLPAGEYPVSSYPVNNLALLTPLPRSATSLLAPGRYPDYGLQMGDWLARGTIGVGAGYDDNLLLTNSHRIPTFLGKTTPNIVALRNAGNNLTLLFASGDFELFPHTTRDNLYVRTGFLHIYTPTDDLRFTFKGEFGHYAYGISDGIALTSAGAALVIPSTTTSIYTSPLQLDQFIGSASVLKSLDRFFVGFGVADVQTIYDPLYTEAGAISESKINSNLGAVTGRIGYAIGPSLYAFGSASGYVRSYNTSLFNSDGYQATAGFGFDGRLYNAEIYGGYQQQLYSSSFWRTVSAPAFGARATWSPTPLLALSAVVQETIQDPGLTYGIIPTLDVYRVISSTVGVGYSITRRLSVSLRGGFSKLEPTNGANIGYDIKVWTAGVGFNYEIARNMMFNIDYFHDNAASNDVASAWKRNVFLAGVKYAY
jgi:hypothetical protein